MQFSFNSTARLYIYRGIFFYPVSYIWVLDCSSYKVIKDLCEIWGHLVVRLHDTTDGIPLVLFSPTVAAENVQKGPLYS